MVGGAQCTERAFGACIGWNLSTCRLAAVEQETETASPSALLIRHQKYDNHPDGQNEHNVGEEVQHLSAGRFPVNQIRRKASWVENFVVRFGIIFGNDHHLAASGVRDLHYRAWQMGPNTSQEADW